MGQLFLTIHCEKLMMESWQLKYQSPEHAQYYAGKHEASALRRVSNFFEHAMIARALRRIQHKVASIGRLADGTKRTCFETVLDCPSGTGRFLPTLAKIATSVIAMDTADTMLAQGRRYYPLFRKSPQAVVGSALDIPLPDNTVDVVLCSRLIHHVGDPKSRVHILKEFARVARYGVVISFFDAASLRAWKRRRKINRTGRKGGRHAISRATCNNEAQLASLTPLGMNALLRYQTEITAAAFLVT